MVTGASPRRPLDVVMISATETACLSVRMGRS